MINYSETVNLLSLLGDVLSLYSIAGDIGEGLVISPVIVECHPSSTSGCVLCSACSIGEVSLDNRTSCIECGPGGWSSVFSPAHYLILTCSNRSLPALRGWSQVHAVSSWYSLQVSRTVHVHVLRHFVIRIV